MYYTNGDRFFFVDGAPTMNSSVTSTTAPTTPSNTVPTITYLIRITLYNASIPIGSQILSIPGETRFMVFHEAITTTIGWDGEPCTFWSFQKTKQSPLVSPPVPGDSAYGIVVPSRLDDHGRLYEWMSLETRCRFWLFDYNVSRQ